ncbi:MaoC/PaaZ C-terminal domain-containing protein [Tautonia sociabilis]|uniref:MaoC/PaaZ C-terminal domain-containing protein n=1 Tax=Tautonia sociabilis TaxID=2080755 RepID=UPI001F38978D|nr:MaoC/PaaZ C-terminal domain-containing protein [Tautonia sociabilis]
MSVHPPQVLRFQDLAIDEAWESPSRTVTQAEITLFAGLSGDYNPVHVDHEAARSGPFGQPIAHGLLGLAIASGLGTGAPRVDTMAFLEIVSWAFHKPILIGDTIRVVTRVEALEPKARGRRGVVTWHRQVLNQRGEVVQEGRTRTMVRGRAEGPAVSDVEEASAG